MLYLDTALYIIYVSCTIHAMHNIVFSLADPKYLIDWINPLIDHADARPCGQN